MASQARAAVETGRARTGAGGVALRVAVVRPCSPYRARAIIARRTRCARFWSRGLSRLYRLVPFLRFCTDFDLSQLFFASKMRSSNLPCFCCYSLMRWFGAFGRVVRQQGVAGVSDGWRPKHVFFVLQPENSGFGSQKQPAVFSFAHWDRFAAHKGGLFLRWFAARS